MRPIAGGLKEQVGFLKQRPALIRKRLGNMARTNIYRKDNRASVNIKRRLSIPGSKKASTSSGPSQAFRKKNSFNTSTNGNYSFILSRCENFEIFFFLTGGVKVYEGKTFPNRTFVNKKLVLSLKS
jgi:hypothetical protein